MIAVALPGIVADFGGSLASATWLVTAYLIVMASVQPLAGKIGDGIGRRKLILGSLVLFLAVSTGAALAPNIWVLLAFRVGQALAISVVLSNSFAVLRQVVPASRRGRTFGIIEGGNGPFGSGRSARWRAADHRDRLESDLFRQHSRRFAGADICLAIAPT